ncbi:hypothetical protein DSO57_1029656 [Entomophthora muscae]|uniref:Uncharacterized protein n=1 Tax=Entomophthora muscae TaxID=34485 RepID=A0ACC2TNY9_9FUNG|nr:hypothetical protein DSO57_1029656 [Entomophthora muscae]
MSYQLFKKTKACDVCRRRKTKCVLSHGDTCDLCQKRKTPCSFTTRQCPRLPPISSLLHEPATCFDSITQLLQSRVLSWGLEPHVPSLVVAFLRSTGPSNPIFPISLLRELLNERQMPEVFPLILSAMDHRLNPSRSTLENARRSMDFLHARDSRLIISSLSIFAAPSTTTLLEPTSPTSILSHNPSSHLLSPPSSEKTFL